MAVEARSYEIANILLSILGIFAWIQIVIGLIGLFSGGLGGNSQLEVTFTIGLKFLSAISVLSGLVSLAIVQMARANVHSAEINWEILQIMRETSLRDRGTNQNKSYSGVSNSANSSTQNTTGAVGEVIKVYQGKEIIREQDGVSIGERKFANVIQAERWMDGG